VCYTPKYITKYIVENTVGKLCQEKKDQLGFKEEAYFEIKKGTHQNTKKQLLEVLDNYRAWLLQITICDPACGSGAFLNQALDFLIKEHRYIDELKAKVLGGGLILSDIENTILENNIYGVDLNEESVEIAKLSLWLRTAQPRRKLNDLSNNIKCGNSLIDSKTVAGDKAFNWQQEFPQIFDKGGFDVIIGNPPYGASFDKKEKEYIENSYKSYQYKFESYLYFYEKGIEILKQNGILSFITPELFLRLDKSFNVRNYINVNSTPIELKFCGENVFQDVKVNSVIATISKSNLEKGNTKIVQESGLEWNYNLDRWRNEESLIFDYEINPFSELIINKINNFSISLGDIGSAIQGLTPYDSYKGQSKEIIKSRAYHHSEKVDETCGIWLGGKNVSRYYYTVGEEWLQYGDWLASPREPKYFIGPRLLFREVPGQNKRIQCAYAEDKYYYGHSVTPFLLSSEYEKSIIFRILALVNSTLLSWYASLKVSNFAKKTFPKLNPKDIKSLPIAKKVLQNEGIEIEINSTNLIGFYNSLNSIIQSFLKYISAQTNNNKFSRKLENWHELDFADFIKELNKAIKKAGGTPLTKKDEFEWLELFEDNKKKAQELQTQITQTEKTIDTMVYDLYSLTQEEREIVENS
jgi:hypothetical protein